MRTLPVKACGIFTAWVGPPWKLMAASSGMPESAMFITTLPPKQ